MGRRRPRRPTPDRAPPPRTIALDREAELRRLILYANRKRHGALFFVAVTLYALARRAVAALPLRGREPVERSPIPTADGDARLLRTGAPVSAASDGLATLPRRVRARRWDEIPLEPSRDLAFEFDDAIVASVDGWISADGRTLLDDVPVTTRRSHAASLAKASANLASAAVRLPGRTLSVTAPQTKSYFHWLVDVLPRAVMFARCLETGWIDRILLPPIIRPFQNETLDVLGIPSEARFHAPDFPYTCEHVVALTDTNVLGYLRPEVRPMLRRAFGLEHARQHGVRLYVSRSDASRRRVTNESAVVELLERYGFSAVTMKGRSVVEQARLFASAEFIVAPHGAGLTNLVFASPGASLLELHPAAYIEPWYFFLSKSLGIPYYALVGSGPRTPKALQTEFWRADLTVDVRQLEAAVTDVLRRSERRRASV